MIKSRTQASFGQTLVEFALLVPLFVLIVMFIFDIGRAVYYYSVLYNAVREGARLAVTGENNINVLEGTVVDHAYGIDLDPAGGVHFQWSGDIVTVAAEFDYRPITPIVSMFLPGGKLAIRAETTMRMEFSP